MNMKKMMTPVLTAAGMLAAVNAYADIELAEGLTATGFVDMSIYAVEDDTDTDPSMGLDQWEIDLMYDFGTGTTARIDLNDLGDGMEVEQAYIEVDLGSGFATKAGLFLSALGYEGPEPVDLWQYSYSATIIGYPGYSNGAALMYGADAFSLYLSVLDGSYDADGDAESLSVEAQVKLFPVEGLTLQAGYASQEFDGVEALDDVPATESYDQGIINFWAEYTTGALTVAAEYNVLMEIGGADGDGDGYLVMANYAFTDKFALTIRTSGVSLDSGYEDTAFTISPSYAINDNLFVLVEARTDDYDDDTLDGESYAAEMIFSF
ncbi:porin [Kiritimatiellaeota bacterium B1221]|nr:porin [Kiritimatiellaeota bacterium B1221]